MKQGDKNKETRGGHRDKNRKDPELEEQKLLQQIRGEDLKTT